MELKPQIARLLLDWYNTARRPLPWRADREPYHVWLSEIMCQQTRVEAVKGYYLRFLEALPDIPSLAACPEDRLLKLWEGLGYYSRARNLQRAAKLLQAEQGGVFPREYQAIRALPGIGDYTAAAIASICFSLPYPAVDGNVLRVVTRYTALDADIALPGTKQQVRELLAPLFQGVDCGELNQALMELGALVCVPNGTPDCGGCPLRQSCASREGQLWRRLPVKQAARPRRKLARTVLLLRCGERIALQKRPSRGLLAGLWEFPAVDGQLSPQAALDLAAAWGCSPASLLLQADRSHVFTHLEWEMRAYGLRCREEGPGLTWVTGPELTQQHSLPTAYRQFFPDIMTEKGELL